ncbi:myosin-like protein [Sarcoptes scabiei]|uniref:Myosin-like protein n=1 Tax=Sarcoptes scabiei TaxID=52283 RepID=A0A132A683_SARSC|nr:myosin-like protein [Sarcoptes scabiei]
MSIEIDLTKRTLLNRSIRMVTEVIHKPYLELEAQRGRDALAKQLFQNLFSYLIKRINYFLRANRLDSNSSDNFSSQDQNDCGGFCTNTTQNNHECFETKQLLIKTIGILDINGFENNDDVCRLFETKPNGIFSLLDEACLVGKNFFNDFRLLELFDQRIIIDPNENFRTKFRFASESDRIVSNRTDFILKHFAGEVQYSIENFIEKNLDQIFDDHIDLLGNTNNGRLKEIFSFNETSKRTLRTNPQKHPKTVSFQFRKSLNALLDHMRDHQQFYVCCIKPFNLIESENKLNDAKIIFDIQKVRHQIQYLGLVELAKLWKTGYYYRFPYEQFVRCYGVIINAKLDQTKDKSEICISNLGENRKICKQIIGKIVDFSKIDQRIAFGQTMIFFRDQTILMRCNEKRREIFEQLIVRIQTSVRKFLAIKQFKRLKLARMINILNDRLEKINFIGEQWSQQMNRFGEDLNRQIISMKANRCIMESFQRLPEESISNSPLAEDILLRTVLDDYANHLHRWLLWLRFSSQFWQERILRIEAAKIFKNHKQEWGYSRRPWSMNYLRQSYETLNVEAFDQLMRKNPEDFPQTSNIFSSYIIRSGRNYTNKIGALIMTDERIYKLNPLTMLHKQWIRIENIESISLTRRSDQLVVIHSIDSDDLVFAFCSIKLDRFRRENSDEKLATNLECHHSSSSANKTGEFVALLKHHYEM